MKVKDLIRQLTEFDMEKEVHISVNYEHEDVICGTCNGYSFPIEGIEPFAGGVDILFSEEMVDKMAKASTIKKLEEIKEKINNPNSIGDDFYDGLYHAEDIVDECLSKLKGETE